MADETKAIVENGNVGPPKTAKQLEKEAKKTSQVGQTEAEARKAAERGPQERE
jgi:hypothetical protein